MDNNLEESIVQDATNAIEYGTRDLMMDYLTCVDDTSYEDDACKMHRFHHLVLLQRCSQIFRRCVSNEIFRRFLSSSVVQSSRFKWREKIVLSKFQLESVFLQSFRGELAVNK